MAVGEAFLPTEIQPDPISHEIDLLDLKVRKVDKDDGKEPSPVMGGE
jgi:hypothetical protein